jgi:hypothetical protein
MRKALLLLLLAVPALADAPSGSVRGTVAIQGAPVPGFTVSITDGTLTRKAVTDVNGSYAFDALPAGRYDVSFALDGLEAKSEQVSVGRDAITLTTAARVAAVTETITVACSFGPPCNDDQEPGTQWDYPTCTDYHLNTSLIEAAEKRDRSAIELLRLRHASTVSRQERARIAGALLGRIADDSTIWKELETHAENYVSFTAHDEETRARLAAYCAEHGYDPGQYLGAAYYSFDAAAHDGRSRPLLLRALASKERELVASAIYGFAMQHDDAALPLIAAELQRLEDPQDLAELLILYESEAADQVALQFIADEQERERYLEERRAQ